MTRSIRRTTVLAIAGVLAITTAIVTGSGALSATSAPPHADLIDTNGVKLGTVTFSITEGKMLVSASVVLPRQFAGFHGFHLHRVGKCEPTAIDPATNARSPFLTASGHIGSEDGHNHALHDGDLPPLLINRDGMARSSVRTDHVSFERIFDSDGTAVIIHAGADDFANIPTRYSATGPDAATLGTGDSGGRVVCGVIRR